MITKQARLLIDEIMQSATRLLAALGLTPSEIANVYSSAASRLVEASPEIPQPGTEQDEYSEGSSKDPGDAELAIWELKDEFDTSPPVKRLHRFSIRIRAMSGLLKSNDAAEAARLAIEAAPNLIEARNFLKALSLKAGLQVEESNRSWALNATDDELDTADQIVFLDDYRFTGSMALSSFELVVNACGRYCLVSEIERISNAIGCEDDAVDFDLRKQIIDGRKIASARQSFIELTEQKLASDEISKSALQSEFVEKYEFRYGKHILDAWLQQLEQVGKLKQFKKSGRWWLRSADRF